MAGPDIFTSDIFELADLCIEAGCFPGLEDKHYVLLLSFWPKKSCEIRRAWVSFVLPSPCRVWLAKGSSRFLLGDSHSLPADLSAGVRPPFIG
ncbi:hypothetical protein ES703_85240 [subsurface metagenome]